MIWDWGCRSAWSARPPWAREPSSIISGMDEIILGMDGSILVERFIPPPLDRQKLQHSRMLLFDPRFHSAPDSSMRSHAALTITHGPNQLWFHTIPHGFGRLHTVPHSIAQSANLVSRQ